MSGKGNARGRAPTPLLAKESGNAVANAAADVVDRIATPFQTLGQPNVSAFDKAQRVVGAAASLANAPSDFMNNAFARVTSPLAQLLPSLPAATVGSLIMGMPHTHSHPPSFIPPAPPIPLPAIGTVLTGCPTVLIGGVPAARSGDFGIAPTCGSLSPIFEIFTGSSNVFIGGSRAARIVDVTRQCGPPPGPNAPPVGKLAKAAQAAQKVAGGVAKLSMVMGAVGAAKKILDTHAEAADAAAADSADARAAAATAAAEASAAILSAAMMGADIGMGAAKQAMGNLMGKDPGLPMCIGVVMVGSPLVLIGGFPMPSWSDAAKGIKKLVAALGRARRGGIARGKSICLECM
jgi:uncharacterized Zn-binding protein involved in type VI secretion